MKKALTLLGAVIVSMNLTAQNLFSDTFNGSAMNSGWIVVNANPSSTAQLTGTGELLLHGSALNGGSDLYSLSNYNAPRCFQPVDTANKNWMVETKLRFNPTNDFQGAGFLALSSSDTANYPAIHRLIERNWAQPDGGNTVRVWLDQQIAHVPYTDTIVYLRCSNSADSLRCYYSPDGVNWTFIGGQTSFPVFYVGLYSIRQAWDGANSVDSYAFFDYFNATSTSQINEPDQNTAINLYPNPNHGTLSLSTGFEIRNGKLLVFDVTGKIVSSEPFNGNHQTLNYNLGKGIYEVQLIWEDKSWTRKLAVE